MSVKAGWQVIVVPRATMILDGSEQPGVPRNPWKDELAAARAVSFTTVPTGKNAEQVPLAFPAASAPRLQLIPAGDEVTVPLPLFPGTIDTLPFENWNCVRTVMIV